ncbi:MAG: hypothetical protein HOK71_16780 [Planctomycetaceae bacterium]|nr:hypothetical protein [Planctomycetaceae bacterium]MBT6486304.1 hypothetical protein [Planctomycetaceae bacterium]
MGALIFLLLVTTRRIRHNAVMDAIVAADVAPDKPLVIPVDVPVREPDEEPATPIVPKMTAVAAPIPEPVPEERPDPNATLRELIAALSQRRDDERKRLEEGNQLVAASRSKLKDSDIRLAQLSQTFKNRKEQLLTTSVNRQVLRAQFTSLGEQIDEATVLLHREKQQNATRSTKYSIVPFDGQSGTTRRPILIECRKNGLTFMQEELTLTAADLDGFTAEYNPLLAGTRALVRYWQAQNKLNDPDEVDAEPYVLLIVRPSGSVAYYAARRLLSELSQSTGYELVAGDRELDVPPSEPQATQLCRRAIESVLGERKRVIDSVARAGRGNDGVLRFQRGNGGFEPVEPEKSIFDRTGKPGFGGRVKGPQGGSNNRSGAGNGRPGSSRRPSESRNPMKADGTGGRRTVGGGTGRLPGQPGTGSRVGENSPGGRLPNGTPGESGTRTSRGNGGDIGTIGEGGRSQGPTGSADRFPDEVSRPSSFGPSGTGTGRDSSTRGTGRPNSNGNGGEPSRGNSGDGQFTGNSRNGGSNANNGGGENTGNGRNSGTGQNSGNAGNTSGGAGGGSPTGGKPGGQPAIPFRTFGRTTSAKGGAGRSRGSGGSGGSPRSRQGHGIGSNRNGIGFERETTIRVSSDRIRVGSQPEISISRFKTFDELTERVLDDLDRHARSWDAPPKNFHWVPVVNFVVSPGGNLYYERLHGPLRKLGISSTSEYPLDTPVYQKPPE